MFIETEFSTSIHIVVDNYMFHVERLQTEEAAINLFIDISEGSKLAPKEQTCDCECHDEMLTFRHDRA